MSKKNFLTVMLTLLNSLQPSYSSQEENNLIILPHGDPLTITYINRDGQGVPEWLKPTGLPNERYAQPLSEISVKDSRGNPIKMYPGAKEKIYMPPSGKTLLNCMRPKNVSEQKCDYSFR